MPTLLHRATLFVLYQVSLLFGIALLPVALVARQAGVELPLHRAVRRLGEAYDRASASAESASA